MVRKGAEGNLSVGWRSCPADSRCFTKVIGRKNLQFFGYEGNLSFGWTINQ